MWWNICADEWKNALFCWSIVSGVLITSFCLIVRLLKNFPIKNHKKYSFSSSSDDFLKKLFVCFNEFFIFIFLLLLSLLSVISLLFQFNSLSFFFHLFLSHTHTHTHTQSINQSSIHPFIHSTHLLIHTVGRGVQPGISHLHRVLWETGEDRRVSLVRRVFTSLICFFEHSWLTFIIVLFCAFFSLYHIYHIHASLMKISLFLSFCTLFTFVLFHLFTIIHPFPLSSFHHTVQPLRTFSPPHCWKIWRRRWSTKKLLWSITSFLSFFLLSIQLRNILRMFLPFIPSHSSS